MNSSYVFLEGKQNPAIFLNDSGKMFMQYTQNLKVPLFGVSNQMMVVLKGNDKLGKNK